jgi:ABC-type uncharacterized transport system involved in gliding motility auxiliary subunit
MKPEWRRFAVIGLYLSLLAAVAAGGLYIVFREFNLYIQICIGFIIIGLALFALLDPQRTREALTGRQARYGSNTLILTIAFIGIIVVANYLIYKYPKQWDLTEDKQNTLSKETLETLSKITDPINTIAFYTSQNPSTQAQDLLENFKRNSNGKFDYKFSDPVADPLTAQNAKITKDGEIVLFQGQRQEHISYISEQELTTAIIKLQNPGDRAVYFLTGHGEHDTDGNGDEGYSYVAESLGTKNYTVNKLNLKTEHQIPSDALALIIAGPQKSLDSDEIKLIENYLDSGGSLIAMIDPVPTTAIGNETDLLAEFLKSKYQITLTNDLIVDPSANPSIIAVASEYGVHAITEKLQNMVTVFPTARSIVASDPSDGSSETVLVRTSQQTWGETDFAAMENNSVSYNANQDSAGPLDIALVLENPQNSSRLIVFGDSDFASNSFFQKYGNGDLLINSIDWAAKQDNLINLTPKQTTKRTLIPPQNYILGLILLGFVFLLPGAVIVAGVSVWIRRRKRG